LRAIGGKEIKVTEAWSAPKRKGVKEAPAHRQPDMSEAPAIVLRFDTIVVAPEHAQTKRQILLSRGLGETFVVSGELPKELLDAVKILQMTELEVYFYEGDLDSVITPRTTMNSLIYLFKHLRELQRDFANTQYLQSINASMEKLGGFCDDFMRYVGRAIGLGRCLPVVRAL
jgi:hypothetical protein